MARMWMAWLAQLAGNKKAASSWHDQGCSSDALTGPHWGLYPQSRLP